MSKKNKKDPINFLVLFALEQLLEYAKYLEDNGQLSYKLLSQRVESFKKDK